ncbi:hypothetical protein FACS189459_3340 [Bacilli bacterium]|nr:hypothetical protein FACS189459_3340 [Bacilli bacterium]
MGSSKQLKQIKKIVSHVRPQDIQTINIIGKAIDHKYFVLENNEVIKTSDLINNIRFGIAHYTINGTFLIPAKHKDGSDYVYTQSDGEGSNNLSSLQIYSDVEIKKLLAQQKPKQKVVTRPPYSFAKLPIDAKEFEHNPHTVKIPNKNFISIAQLQTAPKKLSSLLSLIT